MSSSADVSKALISGTFSGACSVIAGQPLDTVRVRMQTSPHKFSTITSTFIKTIKEERIFSLYKGVSPALTCATIENAVVFAANRQIENIYRTNFLNGDKSPLSLTSSAVIGGLSGIFSAIAISPPEMIKVRMQADSIKENGTRKYKGSIDCIIKSSSESGILGLFRGLPAQLARDIPFNFVFFGGYATVSDSLVKIKNLKSKDELSSLDLIFSGGMAGVIGWAFTIPMDVIKSKVSCLPPRNKSSQLYIDAIQTILHDHGPKGFFKGLGAASLRAFPSNGALFLGYEYSQRLLNNGL